MSYLGERYDDSMRILTRMLKSYRQIEDPQQQELLLRGYWGEEERTLADTRSWNIFRRLCCRLDEAGAISAVVRFLWGVFHLPDRYDRARFQELLSAIPLTPELNLAQLCGDFFLAYLEQSQGEAFPELDVYQEDISRYARLSFQELGLLTKLLPVYLAEKLYGISFRLDSLTTADVDRLAEAIMKRGRMRVEKENEEAEQSNAEAERRETELLAKSGKLFHLPRRMKKPLTDFEQQYAIPGGLLELYRACELKGRDDICYYILERYVWPVFALAPWEAAYSEQVQISAGLIGAYADAMFSQLLGEDPVLTNRRLLPTFYSEEQFFAELTGQTDGPIISGGKRRYARHGSLARALQFSLQRGKSVLKAQMDEYLYSFLMSVTPYMLLSTGQQDAAADFLVRHYDEISLYDKRLLYVQVLLTRSIFATGHLDMAYTLYGYYTYEMDRQERDRERIRQAVWEIIAFLRRSREYIRQSNKYTSESNLSWYECLFGDGRINGMLEGAEACLECGEVPSEEDVRALLRVVDAFSYPTGIRLPLLDIPNQDNYDKLPDALSQELWKQGLGYIGHSDEYFAFYHSMSQQELRRNVDTILQYHISQMVQLTLEDSLRRVERIRQSLTAADEGSEETLHRVEEVYIDLSLRLQKGYLGRAEIERHIAGLERRFREAYCGNFTGQSLLSKLPPKLEQEVRNYLVTGEIVYRLLAAREDTDALDFSAALIPLTKAVEQVLNHIYHRMDVRAYDGLDNNVRQNYFGNDRQKKQNIEFGPGLWLFKDAVYINVKGTAGNYLLEEAKPYSVPHFKEWGGDKVVDFSVLRSLGEGTKKKFLWVDRREHGTNHKTVVFFGTNDRQNRMLLAKGLEYIKDHHRNVVAHKDPVGRDRVDECRDILLLTEDVLWILLAILRSADPAQ